MGSGAQQTTESSDASKAYSLVAIPAQPFDKYVLIGQLGHGGMADVNLAVAEGKSNFRKLIVIKRLHRHLAMEPGFVDMFLDEARLAARLNHPHCVQTHEVGDWEGNHFLAMEYLDGQGLERLIRICGQQGTTIPIDTGARIVSDALDGLAYAHELTDFDGTPLDVVHRDVSPQNIFVTYAGVVKLLDFGIAKAATHVVETRTGVIKGKYAYIAPEQALAAEVDQRADLWSMGVVLWEVLTGRRLFKSVNELATLQETLQGRIRPPSEHRPEVPRELDEICMRALTREPDQRYQTAHEMKEELDRWLASLPKANGRKQISRLMRERFAEVIEVHKQTLAQCLKGSSMTTSTVQQLEPMLTPSGVSTGPRLAVSVTPTPTPSGPSGAIGALSAPAADAVLAPQASEKRGGVAGKVALVLVAMMAAALGAWLVPRGDGASSGAGAAPAEQATGSTDEPAAATPESAQPTAQEEPAREAAPEPPPVREPLPVAPEAHEDVTPDEDVAPRSRHRARHRGRTHTERAPQHEPAEQEQAPAEAPGYLTLATTPWAHVSVGGRDLGTTPLIRVELPAGTHTLHLTNPEQNIDETYRVTIAPGETVTRRLGLR